jgi:hypothetical protein
MCKHEGKQQRIPEEEEKNTPKETDQEQTETQSVSSELPPEEQKEIQQAEAEQVDKPFQDKRISDYINNPTQKDIDVIRNTVAKGCTDKEIAYFMRVAQLQGLDPFSQEIWCYKDKKGNVIVTTGRDGFLKVAQQRTDFNGMRSAVIYENDEIDMNMAEAYVHHKPALKDPGKIIGAWCKVYRKNAEDNLERVLLKERKRNTPVWNSYTPEMLRKDAELIGLKKTFGLVMQNPNDFLIDEQNGTATALPPEEKSGSRHAQKLES